MLLLPLLILLINVVISTTWVQSQSAHQPVATGAGLQPPSIAAHVASLQVPSTSINLQSSTQPELHPLPPSEPAPQLPPHQHQSPLTPTKPPASSMVQLTRTTVASTTPTDSQEFAPTTNSVIPPSSIITIDVSQPPPATHAPTTPHPQLDHNFNHHQHHQPTRSPPTSSIQETPQPAVASTVTLEQRSRVPNPSQPIEVTVAQASNIQPVFSSPSARLTSTPNNNATISTSTTPLPSIHEIPAAMQPQSARLQEARRESPTASSSSTSNSTNAVQFLRARSKKFECSSNLDCHNGICNEKRCFCEDGFRGESCAINIDECRQKEEPCNGNGVCIDEIATYRCECVAGFKGEHCDETVDMCVSMPCQNGGKCMNHRTSYSCECQPGWEGGNCEKNIDECAANPCQNNGTCLDLINDYRCECGTSGFTGKDCEINFDDCAAKPCSIAAKECIDLVNGYKCICHDGFQGERCEDDIDECATNPCQNNGTCVQNSVSLQHLHNLTDLTILSHELKDQNLSSNINMSQYAGYTCECKEEYTGDRCEDKKKCYTKSVLELCNHQQAECVNVGSSYECLIKASFDGSGQDYATYKVNGGFKMKEIQVKFRSLTGGTIMTFQINQPDSPIADLNLNKSGLYLSGTPIKRDEFIKYEELLDGSVRDINLGLDIPIEIEKVTLTGQGMMNDYHSPFKGCLMQVRLNNQLLPLYDYGFGMNNNSVFEMIDNRLEIGQCRTCFDKDCLNRGQCEFQDGFDHCTCPETFTGNFCEIDVNECEKNYNLCLNGGSCENLHGGHRCNCKEGYRGDKCQDISDYCKAKQPCVTGTCKNVNPSQGSYQCECPSSHFGKKCEIKRTCSNECHNHHAQCISNVTCACLPGKREERIMCEYVTSCEQVEGDLCLNGGKCRTLESGGYDCECPKDLFYGPICQFVVEKPQFDAIVLIVITCVGFLITACAVVSLVVFRSVRKARATRGTYSPSTQEKFGNSASDLLKPPQPERLI